MIHIDHAVRGHASGCVCAECGKPLTARQGERNRWHFAHTAGPGDCRYGPETGLHRAAKEIILDAAWVMAPPLYAKDPQGRPVRPAIEPQRLALTDLQGEAKNLPGVVPDVLATVSGMPLAIEIYVEHRVDEQKLARLSELRLATIEIHLRMHRYVSEDHYRELVLTRAERSWVFHPRQAEVDRKLLDDLAAEARARAEEERKRRAQGTARWRMPPPLTAEQRAAKDRAMAGYNARRCVVCGSSKAWFGFGPPLVPKQVWTCRTHRADVDPEMLPEWLKP